MNPLLFPRLVMLATLALSLLIQGACASAGYRPRREFITINTDVYEISVAKNGVTAVNALDGTPIFQGVTPRMLEAESGRFRKLAASAQNVTRVQVNDRLGQGQGLSFYSDDCEWHLCAYPTKPYLSVRLVYRNNSRRPVKVAGLSPWHSDAASQGGVNIGPGEATSVIPFKDDPSGPYEDLDARLAHDACPKIIALRNQISGRALLAGFLTHNLAEACMHVERNSKTPNTDFSRFIALSRFDPPVTVAPGEALEAETLYLSVGEDSINAALNTFSGAVAATHGREPHRPVLGAGLEVCASTDTMPITLERVRAAAAFQQTHLRDWGWTHMTIGTGWEQTPGDWRPAPDRFPGGFEAIQQIVSAAGLNAALRFRPFLAHTSSSLAQTQPDWLVNHTGQHENEMKLLDVSRVEVREWLTRLAAALTTAGFKTLIVDDADALFHAEMPENHPLTRNQQYRLALQALRDGLSPGSALIVSPWRPAALPFTDAITQNVSNVMAAEPAGYFSFGNPLLKGSELRIAVSGLTGNIALDTPILLTAAMTGASLHIADLPETLTQEHISLLRRIQPPLALSGMPHEIISKQDLDIYYQPIRTRAGQWRLVALRNTSLSNPVVADLSLDALNINTNSPYTLYEFIPAIYHGLIANTAEIAVPANSIRFFGLRPYENRPMLLASDRHISQGALDHRNIAWDSENQRLTGEFRADPVAYRLRFLVPPPWEVQDAEVNANNVTLIREKGDVVLLDFSCSQKETVTWTLCFVTK